MHNSFLRGRNCLMRNAIICLLCAYYSIIIVRDKELLGGKPGFFVDKKIVDNVDNYWERMDSPMFTTSPAPIVINKSPWIHCFVTNFSTSEKLGK